MEPFHDIYRKEEPLFLLRRRKKRPSELGEPKPEAPAKATQSGVPPARATQSGASTAATQPGTAPRKDFYHRHRHSRRRPGSDENIGSKKLWIILSVVFVVYAAFLGVTLLRSLRKHASAPVAAPKEPGAEAAATTNAATVAQAEDAARVIKDRIAAWNQVPDAIVGAQTLADRGHLDKAEERLKLAIEACPKTARLKLRLAQLYMEQKDYAAAAPLLLEVLETNPDDSGARMLLGNVYESQTNHPAALSVATWILATEPNSIAAHQMAANAYLNTDRKGLAIQHLKRVVAMERDNIVAQNRLGVTYAELGEYVKAIQVFNEALAHNSTDSVTYYNLAACYARQGMAEQTTEVLSRAIGLFGDKFVAAWVRNPEFDNVREDRLFAALVAPLEKEAKAEEKKGSTAAAPATTPTPGGKP